jgi:NAD(P)-dependent dehydrogenase (short-subunit alcohol dehydrogenase family)
VPTKPMMDTSQRHSPPGYHRRSNALALGGQHRTLTVRRRLRYSYRASKAALNQLVRTAAIELRRRRPAAVCVALHPGTVDTGLSAPFAKAGLEVRPAGRAAECLLRVIDRLAAADSGGFFDYRGDRLPW